MKRFKNISLIYNCDQPTLERAAALAIENEGRLTIVHAMKPIPAAWHHLYVDDKAVDVKKLVMEEQQQELKSIANSLQSLGVNPKTKLLEGEPFVEIIRDIVENDRDLVVMTVDRKPRWKDVFFSNLLSSLMRNCPCPILALQPTEHKSFEKILVAIDPVLVGDSHDTLNSSILELASSLAELENAELHVAHAWTLVGESMMRGRLAVPPLEIDRAIHREFGRRRSLLDDVLKRHSITSEHIHLPKGEPVHEITKLVKDLDIDLLVMGTVCRTGIPGFIIGNTAEQILSEVECSTLTVKPLGFVSPVTPLASTNRDND